MDQCFELLEVGMMEERNELNGTSELNRITEFEIEESNMQGGCPKCRQLI